MTAQAQEHSGKSADTQPSGESPLSKTQASYEEFKKELDNQRLKVAILVLKKKGELAEGPEKACASSSLDAKKSCQELLEKTFREDGDKLDSRHKILFELAAKFEKKATEAFEALKAEASKPNGGDRAKVEGFSKYLENIQDVYYSGNKINLGQQNKLLDLSPEELAKQLTAIKTGPDRPLPEDAKPAVK